jgi:hypothetical protein
MSVTKNRSFQMSVRWDGFRADTGAYNGSNITRLITRTRTGESNPHWREQVRDQQNATTNMTGIFDTLELVRGNCFVVHKNINSSTDSTQYRSWAKGDLISAQLCDWGYTVTENTANNRALIAYLKNVREAQVAFSAPTFLGELAETLRMIRSPAKGLRDLANSWLKKQPRDIFRDRHTKGGAKRYHAWKQNLSSTWLEQAFGWQPLVNDINSAFKTYTGLRDRKDQVPVSGFGIEAKPYAPRTLSNQTTALTTNMKYSYNTVARESCFVKYSGMVTRRVDGSLVSKLEPFGFDFDEFFPTAWELLPWSFLIDYFSNIGDVITCGVANRSSIAWTNRSRVIFQNQDASGYYNKELTAAGFAPGKLLYHNGTNVSYKAQRRTVQRDRGVSVGYPTLSFEVPGLPTQWANMTALFAQANSQVHPQRRPKHR